MKTIGLIGGLSWQSSSEYYRIINEEVNRDFGKNHSAEIIMYSFDFQEIEELQVAEDWTRLDDMMSRAAKKLEKAGAGSILICSNTMHRCSEIIMDRISVPLIHIVDSVGNHLQSLEIQYTGLIGTRYLMESTMYPDILREKYNIKTLLPTPTDMEKINTIIYEELVKGIIKDSSRKTMTDIINKMSLEGIQAIILGCTEIPLLIRQLDCTIPVIDSTFIHAKDAVDNVKKS